MSAWSSGTWCTKKGPPEPTLSRPPAALSRRDLPYASVLASPGSKSLHPHVKPCSRVRPPSSLSHPQSSHAASRSAAACVACSCAAPATTPTPHSPVFVGPGHDASSLLLVVEPVSFIAIPVGPGVDASSSPLAVDEVPFIPPPVGPGVDASSSPLAVAPVPFVPAPTPQHKNPKTPPPKHPQTPVSHRPASTHSHALTQPLLRTNTTCPLPSAPQAREPRPAITHALTR